MMNGRADGVSAETPQEELLAVKGLLQVLWRRLWLIAMVTIVTVGAAVGSSLAQSPQYEASISILIGQKGNVNQAYAPTIFDLQQLTLTMAEAVGSRPVAKAVIEDLDLKGVATPITEIISTDR